MRGTNIIFMKQSILLIITGLISAQVIGDISGLAPEIMAKEEISLFYPDGIKGLLDFISDRYQNLYSSGGFILKHSLFL